MTEERPALADLYASLDHPPNEAQRQAIETLDGPLRIIAGPGSGKTHVLVVRTLNLIACEGVPPNQIAIVTFTEKAAEELQSRIRQYANRLGIRLQLADLNVGTIHWFCGVVLRRFHPDHRRYEPLDDLGQRLFIYDHLTSIMDGLSKADRYLGKWQSKSETIKRVVPWFNKITEETIEPGDLVADDDEFLQMLAAAYDRYRSAMLEAGHLDFSSILRELHDLLATDTAALDQAQAQFSHFMVDEYQDTNYVQEEVLLQLAAPELNIAVVGDDDQSLYRFRGAVVRNILEFPSRVAGMGAPAAEVELTINYRSHPTIIGSYLDFMEDGDWTEGDTQFRTGHEVAADPAVSFGDYTAAAFLQGTPRQLVDTVEELLEGGAVQDASQIALLFHSVSSHASEVIDELRARGIGTYAPRAGRYLDHPEIRATVGVLWGLTEFEENEPDDGPVAGTVRWARQCHGLLADHAELVAWLSRTRRAFLDLEKGEDMSASLLDLVYRALRFEPFRSYLTDPVAARNLGYFTTLIRAFQQHFRFDVLHAGNRGVLPWRLWASFFYMLESTGVDDVEGDQGPPLGLIQVMTIHQAKGLEFPVVIVGSLNKRPMGNKQIDEKLGPFYPRGSYEPLARITEFDHRREFYVAFSRAKHLLVTYSDGNPHRHFGELVDRLTPVRDLDLAELASSLPSEPPTLHDQKPLLSLTSHINMHRRCERQYEFFRERGFAPSFAAQVFFGTVVHQTIEDIHRHVLDQRPEPLNDELITQFFERNSELLRRRGIHPLAPNQREEARKHVQRYFDANEEDLDRVRDTEVEVTLEQETYILNGRIDLIQGEDGALEMVDFKAQKREEEGDQFQHYRDQLTLYHYLLEHRYDQRPERAVLYFTGEDDPERARVVVDISTSDLEDVKRRFDGTAERILAQDFEIREWPEMQTCRACDFQNYCERV